MKQVPKYIREIARGLRNNMTDAEIRLWARIKNEQLSVKFLRQKPLYMFTEDNGLERYIIPDFYCSELQIIIEVDGEVHDDKEILELDKYKEKLLNGMGIHTMRVKNEEILKNTENCIIRIQDYITQLSLCKNTGIGVGNSPFVKGSTQKGGGIITRCNWANPNNELYLKYHDEEWGKAVYDDMILFEFLILEGAQAGLSWETVLKKRENYREAFDGFDYEKIASYGEDKIEELLQNEGIIRNKLKVRSTVKNAKAFIEIRKEFGTFSDYLWGHVNNKQIVNTPNTLSDVPVSTELSDILSKDLKKRGMSFVGTTIMYAYLQAVGVIDDHTIDCFCKK